MAYLVGGREKKSAGNATELVARLFEDSHIGHGIRLFRMKDEIVADNPDHNQEKSFDFPAGKTMTGLYDALIAAAKTYLGAT
ncbi:MAG: hypothetical protein FVQ79_14240 [Planctomycetes bacterium]|nr:hypothetical protein [Planctomycetota bacterium]